MYKGAWKAPKKKESKISVTEERNLSGSQYLAMKIKKDEATDVKTVEITDVSNIQKSPWKDVNSKGGSSLLSTAS